MPVMRARSLTRPALAATALVLALGLSACGDDDSDDDASDDSTPSETADSPASDASAEAGACTYRSDGSASEVSLPPADPTVEGEVPVTLQTSVGEFGLQLDAGNAPCTVNSFVSLAEQGYYDGQSCYRLTTDGIFVLQCGNPTGSPGYTFADELSGTETYGPGTLAMANAGPDTNSSEFFIVYADTPLPPSYTVFGTIDEATLALVEDVAAGGQDNSHPAGGGVPNTPVEIESATVG